MNAEEAKDKFESKDSHAIWQATWDILRCKDRAELKKLKPYIPAFKKILAKVDMGGALRRNEKDTKDALKHIEDMCAGKCHCTGYTGGNLRSPRLEENHNLVKVTREEIRNDSHEIHSWVDCTECSKKFLVREVPGWHVPWYEWKII